MTERTLRDEADKMIEKRIPQLTNKNSIDELWLTMRPSNALKLENISTIGELINHTRSELLQIPNVGKKSIQEIEEALSRFNLKLKET